MRSGIVYRYVIAKDGLYGRCFRIHEEARRCTGSWFKVQDASLKVHPSWIVQLILLILIIVVQTTRSKSPYPYQLVEDPVTGFGLSHDTGKFVVEAFRWMIPVDVTVGDLFRRGTVPVYRISAWQCKNNGDLWLGRSVCPECLH
jgi:hypothetical protein